MSIIGMFTVDTQKCSQMAVSDCVSPIPNIHILATVQ